jgi:lipopolysaccharide heptosyltransferase II
LCESVAALAGSRAHSVAGKTTLAEFIDLAATCSVYLTNDSGPMHVAASLGVPTVAIFGATDHVATGPTGDWARIIRQPVDCSPCLLRECPIDHRCMTRVESAAVVAAARALLAGVGVG